MCLNVCCYSPTIKHNRAQQYNHTCIKKRLRFWYVLRLRSRLVGVHGGARGACLFVVLSAVVVVLLLVSCLLLVAVLLLVLL